MFIGDSVCPTSMPISWHFGCWEVWNIQCHRYLDYLPLITMLWQSWCWGYLSIITMLVIILIKLVFCFRRITSTVFSWNVCTLDVGWYAFGSNQRSEVAISGWFLTGPTHREPEICNFFCIKIYEINGKHWTSCSLAAGRSHFQTLNDLSVEIPIFFAIKKLYSYWDIRFTITINQYVDNFIDSNFIK